MNGFDYIKRNLDDLTCDMENIAKKAGVRLPKLVAVTKSATDEELLALLGFGVTAIGENRPGELKRRGELLREAGYTPELHQIGTLQSNKARLVCSDAALIHSLSSESLMRELDRRGRLLGKRIPVLIEINSASEPQKDGVLPGEAERFLCSCLELPTLEVKGLMTMGPAHATDSELRGYFRLTKKLFDDFNIRYGFGEDATLSMGMSDSFGIAIEEGSTLVRVGRRLFIK